MQDRTEAIRGWWVGQRQKLRLLRQACLPISLVLTWLAVLGIAVIILAPLTASLDALLGGAVALTPLMVGFCWLIRVPDIWDIPAGWVAAATFLSSVPLVLSGRYYAAEVVNTLFREAPDLFPVALTVGSYFGVLLGALTMLVLGGLAVLILLLIWTLLAGITGRCGGRRLLRDLLVYGIAALLVGAALGAVTPLDHLARILVARVAIEADFHPDHRCNTAGWPAGVTRVAFVGDEQVLGYLPNGKRIVALSCRRSDVLGGAQ